jgi:predicted CopG family antitoxin
MNDAIPSDHSIPASLERIDQLLLESGMAPAGTPRARVLQLLAALLRLECSARADALKSLHDATLASGCDPESAAYQRFSTALHELLGRANYREISGAELEEAFGSQALSAVKIEVDMAAFRALSIFARGKSPRSEVIRSLFGLRKKRVDFDVLERVLVLSCNKDGHGTGRAGTRRKAGERGQGSAKADPSKLNLKLFRGIPVPDMEMLLPNTRLRMRKLDQAAVFVPAAISVTLAASKVIFSITAIIALIKFWIGLEREQPVQSGGWGLVAAGSFTLLGITMGAWTKYQKRRLEYANAHSTTLYFQTLDSEAGAFLRVLDEAFEEEVKEATLAYAFLMAHGPSTEPALDARVEAWLREKLGEQVDFEVDDALAKLERLGVATKSGETWTAVAPETAAEALRARWVAAV